MAEKCFLVKQYRMGFFITKCAFQAYRRYPKEDLDILLEYGKILNFLGKVAPYLAKDFSNKLTSNTVFNN